jgi:hypothetical protein
MPSPVVAPASDMDFWSESSKVNCQLFPNQGSVLTGTVQRAHLTSSGPLQFPSHWLVPAPFSSDILGTISSFQGHALVIGRGSSSLSRASPSGGVAGPCRRVRRCCGGFGGRIG